MKGTKKREKIMNTKKAMTGMLVLFAAALFLAGCGENSTPTGQSQSAKQSASATLKPQATCPIMGNAIDKSLYADVNGQRVYVCCAGCIEQVKANPKAALQKLREHGETPERVPSALCGKCGETKGTAKCCKKDAPESTEGSPGCCK